MKNLAKLRQEKGVKQIDMAKMLKVSQGTLSNWERSTHDIDLESLELLCNYFQVTSDYLLGRTTSRQPALSDELNKHFSKWAAFTQTCERNGLTPDDMHAFIPAAKKLKG